MSREWEHLPKNQLPKLIFIRLSPVLDWSEHSPLATSTHNLDYFENAASIDVHKHALLLQCIANIREKDMLNKVCETNTLMELKVPKSITANVPNNQVTRAPAARTSGLKCARNNVSKKKTDDCIRPVKASGITSLSNG